MTLFSHMQPAWEYVCLKGSWGTMDIISLGYNFSWIIILVSCGIVQYEGGQAVITHNVCNIILAEYFHRVGTYKMTTFVKRVVEFSKVGRQLYHPECFDSYPQIYQSTSSVCVDLLINTWPWKPDSLSITFMAHIYISEGQNNYQIL